MSAADVVVIGAGHTGLVAAWRLAAAGLRVVVVERRPIVGGLAVTEEIHPGFRCSTARHAVAPLPPNLASKLRLERHGLRVAEPDPVVFAPAPDGQPLCFHRDVEACARAIRTRSRIDAVNFTALNQALADAGALMRKLLAAPLPELDGGTVRNLWRGLMLGIDFHGLSRTHRAQLLRWVTLPVADLVEEWLDTDIVRAVVAAQGLAGCGVGPRAAGTTLTLLLHGAAAGHPLGVAAAIVGGPGALSNALADAARRAGAEIRTSVPVVRVTTRNGRVAAVVLESGEEIEAASIVSSVDPKRTLLELIDPRELDPEFRARVRHFRSAGAVAKVNLALAALPDFVALRTFEDSARVAALAGRIHIGPTVDYLERAADEAKYGRFSREPVLEITIPSLRDPSLAPAGAHVMSIQAQFAPYVLRDADWDNIQRDGLGDAVIRTLASYAANIPAAVVHRQVLSPVDLEATYGPTGGHLWHGELGLDQLFMMRPFLGWAQYRSPIPGLYLGGAGTHPGVGPTGVSGANAAAALLEDRRRSR